MKNSNSCARPSTLWIIVKKNIKDIDLLFNYYKMLEEASNHSIPDIENSIKNSLIIKREDYNYYKIRICKELCKTVCFCVVVFLFIVGFVIFFVKIVLQ
jgi:hypothetical protein